MAVDELIEYINKNTQHRCLYHFTDEVNFTSIDRRGLLSKKTMRAEGWWPRVTGGNDLSHSLDKQKGIDSYVSLCFINDHPMQFCAKRDGRLLNPRYLKICPEVLKIEGTKISFGIANAASVEICSVEQAVKNLDIEVIYTRTNWSDPEIQKRLQYAKKLEILVPENVPRKFIIGVI